MSRKNNSRNLQRLLRGVALCSASTLAVMAGTAQAQGVDTGTEEIETIVVTGVRGSLQRSMNVKKNSDGIVDAISAEDMGKYPDTNLAESIQRITGVSINRVNGEGSEVTVRGFGPGFNLVTLNGRTMPTANIAAIGGDQTGDTAGGGSRNFDFGNIASDGVSGLKVYKTGKANISSGGIGATLNIETLRPLNRAGSQGSITVKGLHGENVYDGKDWTPEVSGAYSWSNEDRTFGFSLFGAHSERDITTRSATVNGWNIEPGSAFLPGGNRITPGATVTNAPGATEWVSFANDSRYHISDINSKRTNVQATAQWRPVENWLFTADVLFVENEATEQRMDQTNWFNRPFDQVIFEDGPVSTAVFMHETLSPVKDMGFEQQYRSTKDTLKSFGLNAQWNVSDNLTVNFDYHKSKGESLPNNSNGSTSTTVSIGAPVVTSHSVDFRSGFPVQRYEMDDSIRGNDNGRLDLGDLGSQIARTWANSQTHDVDEFRIDATYELGGDSRFDFGAAFRKGELNTTTGETQLVLGDWGISNPGDVEQYAAGLVETFCLSCLYQDFTPGDASVAFRANAVKLYEAMARGYGVNLPTRAMSRNTVEEKVQAAYGQFFVSTEVVGFPTKILAGLRYEKTDVTSSALQSLPTAIIWQSDNDFTRTFGAQVAPPTLKGSYDNWLPNIDVAVNLRDNLIARASYSKTIARPAFNNLYSTVVVNTPNRPIADNGVATADKGNPNLRPLESSNIDFSLEWYYGTDSYVSVGYYNKDVANFLGTGRVNENHFGLRDPSSGLPGTRSGTAMTALDGIGQSPTDVNLFTMTALIQQNGGDVAAATAEYQANLDGNGDLNLTFVEAVYKAEDIAPDATDPLFTFSTRVPINNESANIHGMELAFQHFFGSTGFGVSGSLTTVRGDVAIDRSAPPGVDQFALLGLSDTYNVTLIYDKGPLSGRLSYNWRDEFLSATNRDGNAGNPVFTEAFGVVDVSVNYEITPSILLTFEGLNLTNEHLRTFGRDKSNLYFAQELDTRYQLGVRFKF